MMDQAEVIPVIRTTLLRRGDGRRTPVRIITQFWSSRGELLAEVDPSPDERREEVQMRSALQRIRVHADACLDGGRNAALESLRDIACEGLSECDEAHRDRPAQRALQGVVAEVSRPLTRSLPGHSRIAIQPDDDDHALTPGQRVRLSYEPRAAS